MGVRGGFVWDLAWRDEALATACVDVRAGIVGAARELLAETRESKDFARRATVSAVLGAVADRSETGVAAGWLVNEPANPDALLLAGRVAARRALREAEQGGSGAYGVVEAAARLCVEAAGACVVDPTPWVIALMLERARFWEPRPGPDASTVGDLPGPWHLVEQRIWPRDPFHREAGHRLMEYFAPRYDGSNRAMTMVAEWLAAESPRGHPLRLLPLAAELERTPDIAEQVAGDVQSERRLSMLGKLLREIEAAERDQKAPFPPSSDRGLAKAKLQRELRAAQNPLARHQAVLRLRERVALDVFDAWFQPQRVPPEASLADLSLLAYTLHAVCRFEEAGHVLSYLRPHASPYPWSRDGKPAEVLTGVYRECGVRPP